MFLKLMTGGLLAATAATAALAQPVPPPAPVPPTAPAWGGPQRSETRAEVVQRTQSLFARLDRNRDGVITQDEVASVGDRRGGPGLPTPPAPPLPPAGAPHGPQAMFDQLDLNHDGVITRDEFAQGHARMAAMHPMAGMPGRPGPDGERPARGMGGGRMLMMADANRDGRITLQEMTAAAVQRFDRLDRNHDGVVTPQERAEARAQWGERPS